MNLSAGPGTIRPTSSVQTRSLPVTRRSLPRRSPPVRVRAKRGSASPKLAALHALRAASQAMRFCPTLPVQGRRGVSFGV
jgi:hypothetical protein